MAKQGISTGTTPNDGTGDTLIVGAVKVNDNFSELYTLLGDGNNLTAVIGSGIATAGGTVGTGATILDFRGSGISTVTVSSGIATINITGGGGGSSYSDSDVDTHLNTTSASASEVLSWTGSDYDWVAQSGGGGGESYWEQNDAGINTTSSVGIGTTNPTTKLQVGSTFDPQVIGFGTVQGFAYPSTNVLIGDENTGPNLTPKVGGAWKGLNNNFIGAGAGKLTTTGSNNNFFGLYAGENNTTGYYNNFFGNYVGRANTTGYSNIFIGGYATGNSNLDGNENIFMGYYAGYSNTGGNDNVFLGPAAGKYNTTGNYNVFFGKYAGENNTTGQRNVAIGFFAGQYNTTGNDNIFMGRYSGQKLNSTTDAFSNVFIGNNAGAVNTSGSRNVYIGNGAGSDNTGGSNNVFLGRYAGANTQRNDWSVYLGAKTGVDNFSTNATHKVIIGVGTDTSNANFDSPEPLKSKQLAIGIKTTGTGGHTDYWIVGNENFNVGIGITNPTTKLDVGGTLKVSGFSTFQDNISIPRGKKIYDEIGSQIISFANTTIEVWNRNLTVLHRDFYVQNTFNSNYPFYVDNSQSSALSKVGINSSTPTAELDVNGNVTITGICTATSFSGNGSDVSRQWTLGADGTSNYTFTGPGLTGAENDPTLYLTRGQQYQFVNNMGAHPFRIQSTPNGSTGTQYNDGITNNDVSNGTLTWNVQFDAPNILYYQCTSHPNMGGPIYIIPRTEPAVGVRDVVSGTTGSVGAATTTNLDITGFKSYGLLKVGISSAAWVRLYVDEASRTSDANRSYLVDPTPGSGLIAEVRAETTGSSTFLMTPGVIGWNNDVSVGSTIYTAVTNNEGSSATITVDLTVVKMED